MAATTKVAPWTADQILPLLASSAQAAALSCSGGNGSPTVCGTKWTTGAYDGVTGVGQQMSALEVIQSNLIKKVAGPVSNSTGGTSQGNPSAGTGSSSTPVNAPGRITTKDKAGAGILTAIVLIALLGGGYVSIIDGISISKVYTDYYRSGCPSINWAYGTGVFGKRWEGRLARGIDRWLDL